MPTARISYKPEKIREFYTPYISFDDRTKEFLHNNFINPKITGFLARRGITKQLNDDFLLTDVMFDDIAIGQSGRWDIPSYFYDDILASVHRDSSSGKLVHTPMYSITFSKDSAFKVCEETRVIYSLVKLFEKPLLYYIYIDLQEVVTFLQKSAKV